MGLVGRTWLGICCVWSIVWNLEIFVAVVYNNETKGLKCGKDVVRGMEVQEKETAAPLNDITSYFLHVPLREYVHVMWKTYVLVMSYVTSLK